ncbi:MULTISPECIES: hypothetical protein [Pseudomonas]|uniref:hypothetical protein n=1 Tax=Pseudomonas TaxID=286 RepID=UPI001553F3CA|nr:hypothetical protein [Pseudomonas tumuqii]
MYNSYTALPRLLSPCLAVARYVFQQPVAAVAARLLLSPKEALDPAQEAQARLQIPLFYD